MYYIQHPRMELSSQLLIKEIFPLGTVLIILKSQSTVLLPNQETWSLRFGNDLPPIIPCFSIGAQERREWNLGQNIGILKFRIGLAFQETLFWRLEGRMWSPFLSSLSARVLFKLQLYSFKAFFLKGTQSCVNTVNISFHIDNFI